MDRGSPSAHAAEALHHIVPARYAFRSARDGGCPPVPMKPGRAISPSVLAIALQAAALAIVIPAGVLLHRRFPLFAPLHLLAVLTLLQGTVAALLSRWCRMAWWWQVMQCVFPIAVVVARLLELPPWFSFAAFVFLLLTYWSIARTRVPLYVCGPAVWRMVSGQLPPGAFRFLDVGSGLGGLVLHLAAHHPSGRCAGVEIAPLPWLVSRLRAWRALGRGVRCTFLRGDYLRLDLAQEDVIFSFLSPVAMPVLWQKARAEMRPGTLLLSLEFPVPGVVPDFQHRVEGEARAGRTLFGYRMSGAAESARL